MAGGHLGSDPVAGRSYTGTRLGLVGRAKELSRLYKLHTADVKEQVAEFLARADTMREAIELGLGGPLAHRDVLEIGPGQKRAHLCYFARNNRYIGVDLDVPIEKLTLPALWRILYSNGGIRAAKTLARHIIGADAAFRRELGEHINVNNLSAQLHHMDAAQLTFSDSSFDVVFSISVFEHLPDVPGALKQIDRVLRPGGVAYIVTHIYTSDSGVHDPRLFGEREDIPYWSHLRPQFAHLVRPNCYINKLRLAEYQRAFREAWPSADLSYLPDLDMRAGPALAEVRAKGELPDYSDEELLTNSIVTVWKKGN